MVLIFSLMDHWLRKYKRGRHAQVDPARNLGFLIVVIVAILVLSLAMMVATSIGASDRERSVAQVAGVATVSEFAEDVDLDVGEPGAEAAEGHNVEAAALTDEKGPGDLAVKPGQVRSLEIKDSEGETRRYLLSIPAHYNVDDPEPTPVTFAFHGKTSNPESFIESSLFKTDIIYESIIVMPEGIDASWAGAPYAKTSIEQDVDLTTQLIEEVDSYYNVDHDRVYAIGYSNGGGMVANLGCRVPYRFAGLVLVSGAYYSPIFDGCSREGVAVMTVHGTNDGTVPYDGGKKHDEELLSTLTATDQFSERNGCSIFSNDLDKLPYNQIAVFEGCLYETQHVRIPGGRHVWPKDAETARQMWDFLARQSL